MRLFIRRCAIALPLALILVLVPAIIGRGDVAGDSTPDASGSKNVYIHDSGVATEKLALAQRMEHLGEWAKAADIYQEMLKTLADRLVARTGPGASSTPGSATTPANTYTSVKLAVQEHITHWPPDALRFYRERYEAAAAAELAKATVPGNPLADPAALEEVFEDYFVTDSGKRAGMMLIEQDTEGGDFSAALLVARRLLDLHPSLGADRPLILHRAAIAAHLDGDDAAARQFAAELRGRFAGTIGHVRGQDISLADSADQELARTRPAAEVASADVGQSWPMAFGAPDRATVPLAAAPGGFARLYTLPLGEPLTPGLAAAPQRRDVQAAFERESPSGAYTGIFPVVDHGELFFQDNARLYAVSLESGLPLPAWQHTYPQTQGRYTLRAWSPVKGQQCTVTLTDQCVLAVMAQPDQRENDLIAPGVHSSQLVCLDRRDGHVRWIATPAEFAIDGAPPAVTVVPDASRGQNPNAPAAGQLNQPAPMPRSGAAAIRQLELCGSPLVVGPNVYVTGRGGSGTQFQDCYVVCLDLASGAFRWASYLASAGNDMQVFDTEMGDAGSQSVSHLAYAGGLVYACSNVGAAAAVDALSGNIVWLDLYPRPEIDTSPVGGFQFRMRFTPTTAMAWSFNPVIVSENRVFMLPADGTDVSIYDAATGAVINRIPLAKFENPTALIGVSGNHLVLASARTVWDLDWPNFKPDPPLPDPPIAPEDLCNWALNIAPEHAMTDNGSMDAIVGRPFLTASKLYLSTPGALIPVDIHSGRREARYPATGSLEGDEGPGNVLVAADHVIVAGADKIAVYTNLASALSKLDATIAANPTDPEPRLLYAEILFVAGRLDDSIARLDQAAALLRGQPAPSGASTRPESVSSAGSTLPMAPGPLRDRLFFDAMSFARKLQSHERQADGPTINALYARAGMAAATPVQLVTYALRRAQWARASDLAVPELGLLQDLLLDARQRAVVIGDGDDAGKTAGAVARVRIDELLRKHGREIYADVERDAAAAFKRLTQATAAPGELAELAEEYPNSAVASDALLAAAAGCDKTGDARGAAALRRRWLQSFAAGPQRTQVLEDLARDYLAMPGRLDAAAAQLAAGAKPLAPDNGDASGTAPPPPSSPPPSSAPAFVEPHLLGQLRLPGGRVLSGMSFSQAASLIAQASQVPRLILPDPAVRVFERHAAGQPNFDPFAGEVDDSAVDAAQIVPPMNGTAIAGGNADALGQPLEPAAAPAPTTATAGSVAAIAPGKFGDRIIVFAPGTGLEVFAAGSPKALLICSAVTQQPQAAGFVGDALLVAGDDHVMRISAAGEVVWDFSLRTLGDLEVAMLGPSPNAAPASAEPEAQTDAETAAERNRELVRQQALAANGLAIMPGNALIGQRMIAQQIVIVNGQAVQVGRMAGAGNRPAEVDTAASAAETIVKVAAAGDRLVAATSEGRVLCINQLTGHLLWQTRLDDRDVDELLVDDDFVAVRSGTAATIAGEQSTAHIAVFNADDGHAQFQRSFGVDGGPPLNMALAPDGTLVWLLVDRVAGKNLFEPGQRLRFETFPWQGASNAHCFGSESGGAMEPDQLLIDGHRILAIADSGLALRAFSLDDGQPVALPDGTTRINLANVPNRWDVHILAGGDSVYYTWSTNKVQRFDFGPSPAATQPASWQWPFDPFARSSVDDVVLTARHLMIFYEPGYRRNRPQARMQLCVDCVNPTTIYIELHKRNILDETGIADFRLVDGGLYYLSGNGRLHFLPGAARK